MIPAHRLQLEEIAPRQLGAVLALNKSRTLDPTLAQLIEIRASQLNGCAFCLDMRWKDARERGACTRSPSGARRRFTTTASGPRWRCQFDADELAQVVFANRGDQLLEPALRDHARRARPLRRR